MKTGILAYETIEGAREERRADEQRDGESDFCHDQHAARHAPCSGAAASAGVLERLLHIAARHEDGWDKAKQNRRQRRCRDGPRA